MGRPILISFSNSNIFQMAQTVPKLVLFKMRYTRTRIRIDRSSNPLSLGKCRFKVFLVKVIWIIHLKTMIICIQELFPTSRTSFHIWMSWALNRHLEVATRIILLMTDILVDTLRIRTQGSLATRIKIYQLKMDLSCKVTRILWVAERAKHSSCSKTSSEEKRETTNQSPAPRMTMMIFKLVSRWMLKQNRSWEMLQNPNLSKRWTRLERDLNLVTVILRTISKLWSNKLIIRGRSISCRLARVPKDSTITRHFQTIRKR